MDTTTEHDDNGLDPDDMAEFTKRDAATRSADENDKAGSHDFPAASPAAEMARQHANPANQRDADQSTDDSEVESED